MIALLNYKFAAGVMPPMALFAVTCVGSVAAGVLAHVFVERPVLGLLKSLETRGVGTKVAAMGKWLGATVVQSARGLAQSRYIPERGHHHAGLGTSGISRADLIKPA
jgi:peptidoglycan/LPS O-acetylase OafA/YrhL